MNRSHSAQVLDIDSKRILIDCGEGTQYKLIRNGLSYQKIDIILISHLHGDHYLGLFGLLNTMSLNNRKRPLVIFAPKGLKEVIDIHFKLSNSELNFELTVQVLDELSELIHDRDNVTIRAFPVKHRIPCFAFLVRENFVPRKLNIEACLKYGVDQAEYPKLKSGANLTASDGSVLANSLLTFDPEPAFSYGYVTDTLYLENLTPSFSNVQVLYHEATFLYILLDRAKATFHSTAAQAALFASKAFVSQLIIGHFSSRYDDLNPHLEEARSIFPRTDLAIEDKSFFFK